MDNKELKDLKVGDLVTVHRRNGPVAIRKIEAITKTGLIKVGGELYKPGMGNLRGDCGWDSSHISVATRADADALEHKRLINFIGTNYTDTRIDLATLRQIKALIEPFIKEVTSHDAP